MALHISGNTLQCKIVHDFPYAFWKEKVIFLNILLVHANDKVVFDSGATQLFKGIDVGDFDIGDYLGIEISHDSGISPPCTVVFPAVTPFNLLGFSLHSRPFSYWCNICCNRFCLHFAGKKIL